MKSFIKKNKLIIELIFLFMLSVFLLNITKAQTYYSEITETQYNKIVTGELYYEGRVQLTDGIWYDGWIARFPNSNKLRFRSVDDSIKVHILTDKYVKSFSYILDDSLPTFVFKKIHLTKRRAETKAIELLAVGEINLYLYKTVEKIESYNLLLKNKPIYNMLMDFYVEKNGILYKMKDFEDDLEELIKDKETIYTLYKQTKIMRKGGEFKEYINIILKYNETIN
jgi:hypothetical protein